MSKRTAIAFFLSLLVIMGYNYLLAKKYPPLERPDTAQEIANIDVSTDIPISYDVKQLDGLSGSYEEPSGAEEVVVETDLVKIIFTTSGGRIKSYQLKDYGETAILPEEAKKQIQEIEQQLLSATSEMKEVLLKKREKAEKLFDKVRNEPETAELISLAAIVENDYPPSLLIPGNPKESKTLNTAIYRSDKSSLELSKENPSGKIRFVYNDPYGKTVEKMFTISNDNYLLGLEIVMTGWNNKDIPEETLVLFSGPDVGLRQNQQKGRMKVYQGPVTYFVNDRQGWVRTEKYSRQEEQQSLTRTLEDGTVLWTGVENKYFISAIIPEDRAKAALVAKNIHDEQKAGAVMEWGQNREYEFKIYMGPKREKDMLVADVNLDKSIDYGLFSPIARFIYLTLVFFSKWTKNFGWAIILLCMVTKIVFYPLTHRSFESMQKMQEQMKGIQPEMDALKAKHKDNPQRMNKEVMELYKRKGINPLASCQSGCLPLLLQMPVFFALYAVLYNSIELRGTPFIGWIQDLSAKDPYYVLPVLMGISMFFQQKVTGMGAGSGTQQDQAKMMAIMMPIFLTWIFASLPSGVVLYWLTFNIVTGLQQVLIKKKTRNISV